MTTRVTDTNYKNLRSGHTVWRCIVKSDGTVYMSEIMLAGRRILHVFRGMFGEKGVTSTALCIRRKSRDMGGEFLSDVRGHSAAVQAFTSRRAAKRFVAEVKAGYHPAAVIAAIEHEEFLNSMSGFDDDYYDDPRYDDYYDPHSAAVAEEMY